MTRPTTSTTRNGDRSGVFDEKETTTAAGDRRDLVNSSSVARVVTVKLDASKQGRVHVGDRVVIELLSGTCTARRVSAIAP